MPNQTEISPNVPDVMPDYIDLPPSPRPKNRREGPIQTAAAVSRHAATETRTANPQSPVPEPEPSVSDASAASGTPKTETMPDSATAIPSGASGRHRDSECVPNIPDAQPEFVSESQIASPIKHGRTPEIIPPPAPWSWFRWDVLLTVAIVSVFGFMVFSQAVSALAMAATLPVWVRYALLIPLGVFCLGILVFCGSVVAAWFRLRAVRQVDMAALEELRRRAQTRQDGVEHFQAARAELEHYVGKYPLDADSIQSLKTAGIPLETAEKLVGERKYLLNRTSDSHSWIAEFRDHFQSHLDASAKSRIRQWSLVAAGCAMASPVPLLDAALVLGVSMKMIKDLCRIYNVRSSRSSSLLLLSRAVMTAFIAGVAEDAVGMAGDVAGDELAGMLGESAAAGMGASFAKLAGPKLGEGAINAFFVHRLGRATIRLLQPLKPAK